MESNFAGSWRMAPHWAGVRRSGCRDHQL